MLADSEANDSNIMQPAEFWMHCMQFQQTSIIQLAA